MCSNLPKLGDHGAYDSPHVELVEEADTDEEDGGWGS